MMSTTELTIWIPKVCGFHNPALAPSKSCERVVAVPGPCPKLEGESVVHIHKET
jgi:hypothetical protein